MIIGITINSKYIVIILSGLFWEVFIVKKAYFFTYYQNVYAKYKAIENVGLDIQK